MLCTVEIDVTKRTGRLDKAEYRWDCTHLGTFCASGQWEKRYGMVFDVLYKVARGYA